jgi:hypothetical protein
MYGSGGLAQAVQGLANSVASGGGSSGALSNLQTAFQNLVGAVDPGASSGSGPTLAGFLNALAGDLGAGSSGVTGAFVNTSA